MKSRPAATSASLELLDGQRAALRGSLDFSTVAALLKTGSPVVQAGQVHAIDLAAVSHTDSAGLALLIEWLSIARAASSALAYSNLPAQLSQLAQLSDVGPLLTGSEQAESPAAR